MDQEKLEKLSEQELFDIQNSISDIIKKRNLDNGDIEAITDKSFETGFPKFDGVGLNPWVEGSLIVCPGARIDKTQTKHICKFVVADDEWSWESQHMVSDVIRRDQSSKHFKQHSITLISPFEGLVLQVISQKSQQGKHLVDGIESFIFENCKHSKTMTKTSRSRDH
jgi:hypothetical protein